MPSKILRDEEGNEYKFIMISYDGLHLVEPLPKPEPTLGDSIKDCVNRGYVRPEEMLAFLARDIIREVGRVYNLKREDGK